MFQFVAMMVAGILSACIAVSPTSAQTKEVAQKELTTAEAADLLSRARLPVVSASGYAVDTSDIDGWTLPGVVTFVSLGLDAGNSRERSFLGAYFDQNGNQISTVEILFGDSGRFRSWINEVGSRDGDIVPQPRSMSFCRALDLYLEGEMTLSMIVIAAGGVTALFAGPVGGIVAAAGGVRAALAQQGKLIHKLICS